MYSPRTSMGSSIFDNIRATIKRRLEDRIISVSGILERFERDLSHTMNRLKGREWEFLKNIVSGIIDESFASALTIALYPLGFVEWNEPLTPQVFKPPREEKRTVKNPVMLVHGYVMNNSNFLLMRRRLKESSWSYVYLLNLKTHKHYVEEMAVTLSRRIGSVLKSSPFNKVDIVAHSLGGLVSRYYIQFLGGYKRVNTLITLGTPHQGTELFFVGTFKSAAQMNPRGEFIRKINQENIKNLEKVKVYSIWSPFDMAVVPPELAKVECTPKAVNIRVDFVGHMGLLFNARVFEVMKYILNRHAIRRKFNGNSGTA